LKQVVQDLKTGRIELIDVPPPTCGAGALLVRNLYSVVSAGTERATVETGQKSIIGMAISRPDLVRQVIQNVKHEGIVATLNKVRAKLEAYRSLGYSSAGVVLEAGADVPGLSPGDLVACGGGDHAVHAEVVAVPKNLCARVPSGVRADHAALATLGAIAVQGFRNSGATLGETVAVIGLGLIGQLAALVARAAGCRVLGVDVKPECALLAQELGAARVAVSGRDDVDRAAAELTSGRGVDAILVTADAANSDPIETAARIARDRACISVIGNVVMQLPRRPFYEKELQLRLSRSYGPGRYDPNYEDKGQDYPAGYVRWTEQRNLDAFLSLLAEGRIELEKIITHRFPAERAVEAYDLLLNRAERLRMAILLEFPNDNPPLSRSVATGKDGTGRPRSTVRIGVIGAGNFAAAHLIPALKSDPRVALAAVATSTGARARTVAEKFGFQSCTTDYREILREPSIDGVVIATRHGLHGPLAAEALAAGKAVFVEKPLVLKREELGPIVSAVRAGPGRLMVGFNRRFAPLLERLMALFPREGPRVMSMRVNAGPLPREHWIFDPDQGGGRILGEACHFVDLLHWLAGAPPARVYAEKLSEEDAAITLKFGNGSIGTLLYLAGGDPSLPKERLEVDGGGRSAILDDFRCLTVYASGRKKKITEWSRDKGHRREMAAFVDAVAGASPMPVPAEELFLSSLATLAAAESLRKGGPVDIAPP
jgi:predicted dehydrogenase